MLRQLSLVFGIASAASASFAQTPIGSLGLGGLVEGDSAAVRESGAVFSTAALSLLPRSPAGLLHAPRQFFYDGVDFGSLESPADPAWAATLGTDGPAFSLVLEELDLVDLRRGPGGQDYLFMAGSGTLFQAEGASAPEGFDWTLRVMSKPNVDWSFLALQNNLQAIPEPNALLGLAALLGPLAVVRRRRPVGR